MIYYYIHYPIHCMSVYVLPLNYFYNFKIRSKILKLLLPLSLILFRLIIFKLSNGARIFFNGPVDPKKLPRTNNHDLFIALI